MNGEEYQEAVEEFTKIPDYKDSSELGVLCEKKAVFSNASVAFEAGEYQKAYDLLVSLESSKERDELLQQTTYLLASELYDKGDYENAYLYFGKLDNYKDSTERTSEAGYQYAQKLMEVEDWNKACTVLKKLGDYADSASLYQEASYNHAEELLSSDNLLSAASIFRILGDYKDSQTKLLEAEYGYVKNNQDNNHPSTYKFLLDLIEANYKDSKQIFDTVYKWTVTLVMNDSEYNTTKNMTEISKYKDFYCHVRLDGGPPGDAIGLKYTMIFPDGSKTSNEWEGLWLSGYRGYCIGYYERPAYGATGTLRVQIYNKENNTLLGETSVKII